MTNQMNYTSSDIAVIIPTRNRPELIKRHLNSLVDQECKIGRVIVVASGIDVESIVIGFKDRLPVE